MASEALGGIPLLITFAEAVRYEKVVM